MFHIYQNTRPFIINCVFFNLFNNNKTNKYRKTLYFRNDA